MFRNNVIPGQQTYDNYLSEIGIEIVLFGWLSKERQPEKKEQWDPKIKIKPKFTNWVQEIKWNWVLELIPKIEIKLYS